MILSASWRATVAVALGLAPFTTSGGTAQTDSVATARRIADIATIALAEYAEGVTGGRVVQVEEWNEARLFIDEARRLAEQLPPTVAASIGGQLEVLLAGVAELTPQSQLDEELVQLRIALEVAVGVPLDPLPRRAPSLALGRDVYRGMCASCHGEHGAGDGALGVGLVPPPADLTDRHRLAGTGPLDFFRTVNVGVAGTAMPGFADQLDVDDRWAVALHAATLRFPPQARERGRDIVQRRCPDCLVLLSDFDATAGLSDDSLASLLADRIVSLPQDSTLMAVAYARTAAAREELGNNRVLETERVVGRVKNVAREALGLAHVGDQAAAVRRSVDAYLLFERIESTVRARNPSVARGVEQAFAQHRAALQSSDVPARWEGAMQDVDAALDAVLDEMRVRTSPPVLFGQSITILLREGIEAILILGALAAVLSKAGAPDRKRDLAIGALAALGASILTALGFATLFRRATAQQELIEGITMLVAAIVLFWVSYWLISKIEIRKWQAFVRKQMQKALSSKRTYALAAVAFLAVYREGFETVLFYAALFTTSDRTPTAVTAIVGGIVVASAVLAVTYYAMQRYGLRLPLKPFFAITSAFLYIMAFSFAGQGVAELQEAGLVSATPLDWVPRVPILGIFPTTQTLLSQLLIALALVGALFWVFWLEPKAADVRSSS